MANYANNSKVCRLYKHGLLNNPPKWLIDNLMFEGITGSQAYGCSDADSSDVDIVGFAIPPKYVVFPHLVGYIPGFGSKPENFDQYQQHHVEDKETRRTYDLVVYGIIKFVNLTMGGNPNMIDNMFIPRNCITKSSQVYEHLRENRKLFLSSRVLYSFKNYASDQLAKIEGGRSKENSKRAEAIKKYGFDTKFAYHIVRLMLECEQILTTGNLILDRDGHILRSIREGGWTLDRIKSWYTAKEISLEGVMSNPAVPAYVDEEAIRRVLIECLEIHYGSLADSVKDDSRDERILDDVQKVISKYRG